MMILASTSASRQRMLSAAGVCFDVMAPDVDETVITKRLLTKNATPQMIAGALADAKAVAVSKQRPGAWVLGSDSVLCFAGDQMLDKAKSLTEVAKHLRLLSGQTHQLISAAAMAQDGEVKWQVIDISELTMRDLSEEFIADYVTKVGDQVMGSVGAYHLEGLGAQLFAQISGDHFSIRGLPLLPVLEFLRQQKVLLV